MFVVVCLFVVLVVVMFCGFCVWWCVVVVFGCLWAVVLDVVLCCCGFAFFVSEYFCMFVFLLWFVVVCVLACLKYLCGVMSMFILLF